MFCCLQKWAEEEGHSDGEGKILYGIPVSLKNDVSLVVSVFQYVCLVSIKPFKETRIDYSLEFNVRIRDDFGPINFRKGSKLNSLRFVPNL